MIASYEEAGEAREGSRTWPRAAWSLAWQTARELGGLWWKLALIGTGRAGAPERSGLRRRRGPGDPTFLWAVFNVAAGILAGVNMFGTEYGSRTHRFLAHHAVRPG